MELKKFDVILLGHFAIDNDVVNGIEKEVTGSAVYHGAFALNAIGAKVAIVTKLAKKHFPMLNIFEDVGISVFPTESEETTGIRNVYTTDDPDNRKSYFLRSASPFYEKDFPPELSSKVIHIASLMQKEVPVAMLKKLSERADLSIDVQGFMRTREGNDLILKDWKEKAEIIPCLRYLKADIAEATILTGTSNLKKAAIILSQLGAKEVLLTHKEGVLLYVGDHFYQAPFSPKSLKGRSGRGDTCISSYIGKRLSMDPCQALNFAAALTTLKLEQEGPFRGNIKDVETVLEKNKLNEF